jgi:hypothetical protein
MNHLGMVYLSAAATILQYDQLKIKILSFMKTVLSFEFSMKVRQISSSGFQSGFKCD